MVAIASLYLHCTLYEAFQTAYKGPGHSHALPASAHGLGAHKKELALRDLHDFRRIGIICDAHG